MSDDEEYVYEDEEEEYNYSDDDAYMEDENIGKDGVEETSGSAALSSSAKSTDSSSLSSSFTSSSPISAMEAASSSSSSAEKKSVRSQSTLSVADGTFRIANYSDIERVMSGLVQEVSNLLDVSSDLSKLLLQYFRWDKEKLVESYFSDAEKVMLDAGLDRYAEAFTPFLSEPAESKAVCRICCDEVPRCSLFGLGCEHYFCTDCYGEYVRQLIGDGPICVHAVCPEHKCRQLLPQQAVTRLVSAEASEKHRIYLTRNFIEKSKNMRWCPSPGCDKVVVGSGVTTALCSCGKPFCFKCGEEAHDPAGCEQLGEWAMKCSNESETANWILANTKKCPECNARIEKNQGCNHMSCKLCKHEFCWICMGSWKDHGQTTGGFYKCNRYDPDKPDSSASAAEKAKAELDRYLHYYKRFHGHDHALKFASGQREQAEKRMIDMQESGKSAWIDVQFLKQAVEQVIDCRRVLKYTYVLGYFLTDGTAEKHLFEHHQEMLEKHTEKLSEYTEQSPESIDRTQVVNLTRVTEKFMSSLLSSLMNRSDETDSGSAVESKSKAEDRPSSGTSKSAGKGAGGSSLPAGRASSRSPRSATNDIIDGNERASRRSRR